VVVFLSRQAAVSFCQRQSQDQLSHLDDYDPYGPYPTCPA